MHRHTLAAAVTAAVLLAGCGRVETPERRAARREAKRDACVATELLIHSHGTARELGEFSQAGPLANVLRASNAFAGAYDQYAQARAAQLTYLDSASAAGSDGDSTRYAAEAAKRAAPAPQPGTVDESARKRYASDFAAARANPDHPCNKPELEEDGGS
jgi:hypothetical protein